MKQLFIGALKGSMGLFIIAEVIHKDDKLSVKNVLRILEMPATDRSITYQFHPDPYFCNESETFLDLSDFVMYKFSSSESADPAIKRYLDFITKTRAQRSGIVLEHPTLTRGTLESV